MLACRFPIILALLALTACGENGQVFAPVGVGQQAIRGGSDDYNSSAVVGIFMDTPSGGSICSGSLIGPNLVLTAQHCIAQLNSEYVVCGQTPFGRLFSPGDVYVTTERIMRRGARFYTVREVLVPQQFQDTCGNDIALLVLNDNISANEAQPLMPRVDSPPAAGDLYTAIGYGHVGNGSGSGARRYVQNKQILCTVGQCPRMAPGQVDGREFMGNEGVCQGDSGGPAIDQNGQVLAAVSRGAEGCQNPVYSAVYPWRDWIKSEALRAADTGNYRAPDWADPPPPDFDLDGYVDDEDNCAQISNPDQADLDEDGLGDACDGSVDRECAVCRSCNDDSECGPGALCGVGGICRMACRVDTDCPGGASTTCMTLSGERICMNVNAEAAGFCPEAYACGVVPAPTSPEQEPTDRPRTVPYPGAPLADGNGNGSTSASNPSSSQSDVTLAEPEDDRIKGRAMITFENCDVMPDRTPPGTSFLMWLSLLGLGALRRRRWEIVDGDGSPS